MNYPGGLSRPQAMVVLASEQLWPNIEAIVFWHEKAGGLTDLFIYHTADRQKSEEPARRLNRFIRGLYPSSSSVPPSIKVHLPDQPKSMFPHDVFEQIKTWLEELPEHQFIVNITGGTKLMTAGALATMHLPRVTVVYRELTGEWYQIGLASQGQVTRRFTIPPGTCNHIPVRLLVEAQSSMPGDWQDQRVEELPIVDLVRLGLETNWNWSIMFSSCGLPTDQAGFLFEKFVAACLRALGIAQISLNLKLTGSDGRTLQEVDIAANFNSRLYVIDCKLRSHEETGVTVESVTSQIRQAAATRRELGGPAASYLLVRPNYSFHEAEKSLLQALGLSWIDAAESMNFFRKLAEFFDFPSGRLPPLLEQAQALLDQAREQGFAQAFARGSVFRKILLDEPLRLPILLDSLWQSLMQHVQQDWLIYKSENTYEIVGHYPKCLSGKMVKNVPEEIHQALAWLEQQGFRLDWSTFRRSKTGETFRVSLNPVPPHSLPRLQQLIAERLHTKLFHNGT